MRSTVCKELLESNYPERLPRQIGLAVEYQISQHLADHGTELVAVAREAGCNGYLWERRMSIEDEPFVRGVRVQARLHSHRRPSSTGKKSVAEPLEDRTIRSVDLDHPHLTPCPDPVSALVYNAQGFEIDTLH